MKLKNIIRIASFVLLVSVSLPAMAGTILSDSAQTAAAAKTEARAQELVKRLTDIRDMDKSTLTRAEKKDLRKEVKGIRKEMREGSKGIYLSIGAVIIIVLLLILIL